MKRIVVLLGLLVGFVWADKSFAQTCGTAEANSGYWENFPNKRIVHRDGKTYLQVVYYLPNGINKLRRRKIFQDLFGCRKGCGLCAAGIVMYDITNGNPEFVAYVVIFPDQESDNLPDGAFKNEFGEWEVHGWQVVEDSNGLLIVPAK